MIYLSQMQKFLDGYLLFDKKMDTAVIDPYMTNGLLVKGREEVKKVGFGVSASLELFGLAQKENCDAIVVHHSFNLPPTNRYDEIFQNRIGYLLQNDISLFGYHFLLDAHPQVGNNAQILETVGAKKEAQYFFHGYPWGWTGVFEKPQTLENIIGNLRPYLSKRLTVYDFGPEKVKKVVALSGKGAPGASEIQDLIDEKVDLYVTGEVHEWNRELFREAGVHLIAGGHYATEVFGLRALMDKVSAQFPDIDTKWLKLHNEV